MYVFELVLKINPNYSLTIYLGGSNYTLNILSANSVDIIVGAVTPSTAVNKACSPSGFYNIDITTGINLVYFYIVLFN